MGENKNVMELNESERKVVQLIREIGYGQLVVTVKESAAVHVEARKSILIKNK